jgi:hypothetical protein
LKKSNLIIMIRHTFFLILFSFVNTLTFAQLVPATIVVQEGDSVGVAIIDNFNNPLTNEEGQVGFSFGLDNGDDGMWSDAAPIHLNSSDPALSGIEFSSGIGNNGNFIISPSYNGADAVYGQDGLIAEEDTQAEGFPSGVNTTFHSRPFMLGEDIAYWIAGLNFDGGTSSQERALYKLSSAGVQTPVYYSSDTAGLLIGGFRADGLDFDFYVSDNDQHIIQVIDLNTGSTTDDLALVLNGTTILAKEGSPSNIAGHNWDNFDNMSINNNGDYVFSGDTDGATTSDEFIALNGMIVIQEGDTLDGIELTSPLFIRNVSINDFGKIGFVLSANSLETFFESDINDVAGNAKAIATVGDSLDINNDGLADFIVDDFNGGSGVSLDLSEHNHAFLELDITRIGTSISNEAMVKFNLDCPELITLQNGGGDINSAIPVYAEADTITASNVIGVGANVGYDALTEVNLLAGFEVAIGILFEARIDGCGNLSGPIN